MKKLLLTFLIIQGLIACGSSDEQSEIQTSKKKGAVQSNLDASEADKVDYSENKVLRNGCYAVDPKVCYIEKLILKKTNRLRGNRPQLGHSGKIAWAARQWSQEQFKIGEISHDGFPHARVRTYEREFMVRSFLFSGENVAATSELGINATAEQIATFIVKTWWNSPPHKDNMLDEGHRIMGVGLHYENGVWTATQLFAKALKK